MNFSKCIAASLMLFALCAAEKPAKDSEKRIAENGKILGISLEMKVEEAHKKLDPLRIPGSEFREKGARREEKRELWRFKETEFQWLMAWTNDEGRIMRISASLRPESPKPFDQIGDLKSATSHNDSRAIWNVTREKGEGFRLVAKGKEQRAQIIYILSLTEEERN